MLSAERFFVGIFNNIDYVQQIVHFWTLEHNESDPDHKFYCKRHLTFQHQNFKQTIITIFEDGAKEYVTKHASKPDQKDEENSVDNIDFSTKREELDVVFGAKKSWHLNIPTQSLSEFQKSAY